MSEEWIWLGVLFATIGGLCYGVLEWSNRRRRRTEDRLARRPDDSDTDSQPDLVLGEMTPPLAGQLPMPESTRADLAQELRAAGYYRPSAVTEYAAIRAVLVIVPLLTAGVLAVVLASAALPKVLVGGLAVSVLGFSLPRLFINWRARVRARQIERGLPVAVDLLTLGLSGGQSILSALRRVAKEIGLAYPVLAQELRIVEQQTELSSLEHALVQWADRVQVPEVRNLALILTHSERLGTDVGNALLEFSNNFRMTLRQRAESQANRASFWMVFPTLFCLWIPAAIILIGPIYAEFWQRRERAREIVSNPTGAMENANRSRRPPASARTPSTEEGGSPGEESAGSTPP
jgi:tight adherence protein C